MTTLCKGLKSQGLLVHTAYSLIEYIKYCGKDSQNIHIYMSVSVSMIMSICKLWRHIESKHVEMSQKLDSPSSNQLMTALILSMDGIWLTPEHSEQIKKTVYRFFYYKNAKMVWSITVFWIGYFLPSMCLYSRPLLVFPLG